MTEARPRKTKSRLILGVLAFGLVLSAAALYKLGPRIYNARRLHAFEGRSVYDENANAELMLTQALQRANTEKKRVLVIFGGNWCKWCLALDDLLKTDQELRELVQQRFVLLKLDGDAGAELDKRWGRPTQLGVPVLVFLNLDGSVAHVQGTVELESWGGRILAHDRKRVLDVLGKWVTS